MRVNQAEALECAARAYPLLADLPPNFLTKLLEIAEERKFTRNEIIFGEGGKSECLFLIASGSVALETITGSQKVIIQTLSAGDAMGWSALNRTAKTHFQARALSPVRAIAFDGAKLSVALECDPHLGFEVMKRLLALVTERLDYTRMQLIDTHRRSGAGRRIGNGPRIAVR